MELPGESRGILRPSDEWGPVTLASISFGQEIGVTPLQMVAAANVVATSGYLMRPRLLLGFGNAAGDMQAPFAPEPVRRVIEDETARRLKELLTGVVERGTGQARPNPRLSRRRQDRHGAKSGPRRLLENRLHRIVRRVRARR